MTGDKVCSVSVIPLVTFRISFAYYRLNMHMFGFVDASGPHAPGRSFFSCNLYVGAALPPLTKRDRRCNLYVGAALAALHHTVIDTLPDLRVVCQLPERLHGQPFISQLTFSQFPVVFELPASSATSTAHQQSLCRNIVLSSHLLLSIYLLLRSPWVHYTILHYISCSILHESVRTYIHCTHAHACMHCIRSIDAYVALCYYLHTLIAYLRTYSHLSNLCMHAYIHTIQAYTQARPTRHFLWI